MSVHPPSPPAEPATEQQQNIVTAIAEVSERASLLIREEIELAKAEVTEKGMRLVRGAVVGMAAGVFLVMAVMFALVGCAWLLYYFLPGNDFTFFWGFFAMAVILLLLGVLAGVVAAKVVKRSAPPMPTMAIEEARKIRETVSAGSDTLASARAAQAAPLAAQAAPPQQPAAAPPPWVPDPAAGAGTSAAPGGAAGGAKDEG